MVTLEGEIFSGDGEAEKFLSLRPYQDFLKETLGNSIFPGTLNIKSTAEKIEELLAELDGRRLEAFNYRGKDYGGITVYPIKIEGKEAGLLEIDRTKYGDKVIEIVADEDLREALNLEDSDKVKIKPRESF